MPVARPDRGEVPDPLGVVPHPVAVDGPGARRLGDADARAVHIRRDAGDHLAGRGAEAGGPPRANEVVVAPDPARRDEHGRRAELEAPDDLPGRRRAPRRAVRREHRPGGADHSAALDDERLDPVARSPVEASVRDRGPHAVGEGLREPGPRSPRDVEPWHGVPVTRRGEAAALRPADHRREPHALRPQPVALLPRRPLDVGAAPARRPVVLGQNAVEPIPARRALPVLPGELERVVHPEPALRRRVDEEDAAERPERLPAEVRGVLLVEEDDPPARVEELADGDEPGQPASDDDRVRVHPTSSSASQGAFASIRDDARDESCPDECHADESRHDLRDRQPDRQQQDDRECADGPHRAVLEIPELPERPLPDQVDRDRPM